MTIIEEKDKTIPYGHCKCGCGEKTRLRRWTNKRLGYVKGEPRDYLFNHHKIKKPSRYISPKGYVILRNHEGPGADKLGNIQEHRLVAEQMLGHTLPPQAVVHHYGDKQDNTKLIICENQAEHMVLHRRERALEACGHADWRKCRVCKQWDDPDNLTINKWTVYHKKCRREQYKAKKGDDYHE